MKIRHKITFISSTVFAIVLGLISILIFKGFSESSKKIFYRELARTAKISALFYLEEDEMSKKKYAPISKAFSDLNSNEAISIYNSNNQLAFNTSPQEQVVEINLDDIRNGKVDNFQIDDYFYHGLFYEDNQGEFVILVSAENPFFYNQRQYLLIILSIAFLVGMLILILATNYLSRLVYRPVSNVIRQVNDLNLNKKPLSLAYPQSHDELEELFKAFNSLLFEIERTYTIQKNFIDHASHELKTPLAGIINDLEITTLKERSPEVYKVKMDEVLVDANRLKLILDNLLLLSELEKNKEIKQDWIRIDEVLWEILAQLSKKYSPERFQLDFQVPPEFFNHLKIYANETLLYISLYNFLDNSAKFSSEEIVNISLSVDQDQLIVIIEDKGIGIAEDELELLRQPFHRGKNALKFEGNGLGLSIAFKILNMQNTAVNIQSELNKGTRVKLTFLN